MPFLHAPYIYIRRLRTSRGYGVHSPFAYGFITQVVGAREPYYAYEGLRERYGRRDAARRELLFRLVNFAQPRSLTLLGATEAERTYMTAAAPKAHVNADECGDFVYLTGSAGLRACDISSQKLLMRIASQARRPALPVTQARRPALPVIVVGRLGDHRALWHDLLADPRRTMAFDLYDLGVVFFLPTLPRQEYQIYY